MTAPTRPLPVVDDADTGGFFAAAARHQLVVRGCLSCQAVLHPPRPHCGACGSWDTAWRDLPGTGRVVSWTVVEHPAHPAFAVPYTVLLVEVDGAEGARLVGHLEGVPHLFDGARVRVRWEHVADDTVLPQWQLEGET
jgi:uncharacterized OB-fold protein